MAPTTGIWQGGLALLHRSGLESSQIQSTSFVAVVGPQTVWPGGKRRSYKDVGDGTHDTLMVVEVPDGQFLCGNERVSGDPPKGEMSA